jgi:hypothetical protein
MVFKRDQMRKSKVKLDNLIAFTHSGFYI